MEGKHDREGREERDLLAENVTARDADPNGLPAHSPSWRGLVVAVIAAASLSVAATLLLGGSFGPGRANSAEGCGPGSACCPPAGEQIKTAK